ncbi:hypothetical protein OCU04_007326 [Sclerotinia nivalis]|uniref:Uncharacterized protein n=1 Tax=Sclerotinia nivalis TaxID=352851 RepID=A0A9X0DJU5_9HELO|nr:hypothetical protein OCU04_007326 [Sclerotinia nivalis]
MAVVQLHEMEGCLLRPLQHSSTIENAFLKLQKISPSLFAKAAICRKSSSYSPSAIQPTIQKGHTRWRTHRTSGTTRKASSASDTLALISGILGCAPDWTTYK